MLRASSFSDRDLTDYVPLTKDDHDGIVTQYSMEPLGELGLLKMDFLGLKTLTVIQDALKLIEGNDRQEDHAAGNPRSTIPPLTN